MKDLEKQSQPGFDWTFVSNAQGTCIEVADDYDNQGNEDASIGKEYKKADSSNSNAEELVSGDDDYYEQEKPDSTVIEVADAEFYDFDWYKSEECFAVDQIWAIYDCLDAMPRAYARINKVYSPFKVDVTRLEYVAGDVDETAWGRSGLPVACGKFKLGKTGILEDVVSFSHKIFMQKSIDESCTIYPQRGETWALYKNWSSADPNNHKEYEYEFVLVLSDYIKEVGVFAAHLVKLRGFVCLFKPTKTNGMMAFQIPSSEILRFSHRVPSFRTNGKEGKDVPEGYFELDPCSLPSNLEEVPEFSDMEVETVDGLLKSVSKEKNPMQKLRKNPSAESTLDRSFPGGNKSSRMSNGCDHNLHEEKRGATIVSVSEKNVAAHAKKMSPDGVIAVPSSVKFKADTEFKNFDEERSCEKFKTGQIWALYSKLDKLPKKYAQIESVESFPVFKLAVNWLKSCNPPRGIIPWVDKEMPVSCGRFKVTCSEAVVFNESNSFSHQLSEVPAANNMYTIHPRAGEVWAVYSKFRSDLTCSDLKKCKYDIVEILEVVDVHWIIVSILERVAGFKTVFKAKEKERLGSTAAIPWIELYRFSHQVPSFMLAGARYGNLRGCLELDPKSLSVY